MRKTILALASLLLPPLLSAQEALKSAEEEYYDFLSLTGQAERPTLGYRTLSDSEWTITDENHIWAENNLGTKYTLWEKEHPAENRFANGIDQSVKVRIYGPEWYNSYNTAAPYGQNDGALWQGKGYNTSFTAGARLEAYGFEVTFKPQLSFSQNKEFDLMDNSAYYTNKYAYIWGYGNNVGVDAPQRFGDSSFWTYDWGDTEARWSWSSFTVGAGTQSIWIGQSYFNPILHSNNAASYPKIDIGFRKTSISVPFLGWNLGFIEARAWMGYLTESDYFDNDSSNDHNRINGFIFSYAPSFLEGFSLGLTKVCLSKWSSFELKYMNPFYDDNSGIGTAVGEDQKMSVYADWLVPEGGIEVYGEAAIDDYFQGGWKTGLIRYPFDTLIWTFGVKKTVKILPKKDIYGELIFEFSEMELPRNKVTSGQTYSFNSHYQIKQGYTNRGQYIGTALATGGNAQTLQFNVYYKKGKTALLLQRANPDNTYSYLNLYNNNQTYKGYGLIGLENTYYVIPQLRILTGFAYQKIINSLYFDKTDNKKGTKTVRNLSFTFGCSYNF